MTSFTLADADTVRQFAESHVDEGWDPVEVGNEDQIGNIVMDARVKGVITCPSSEVDFDYSADGDGGGFQFLVRLTRDTANGPRSITLASPFNDMRNVVSSEVTGPAAVAEILETAVVEANAVVADLVAFQAAGPRALVGPTGGEDGRCEVCRDPEHDACPLVPGCTCCADTIARTQGGYQP